MTPMRNILRKIWPIAKFAIAFLLLYFAIKIILIQLFMSMAEGKDVVAELGGGKYEIGKSNDHLILEDHRFKDDTYRSLVMIIEKYSVVGNQIYIVGDYTRSYCAKKDELSRRPCKHMDFATGEYTYYKKGEPVPRYTILDFENDKLRTYVSLEDVPAGDRTVFGNANPVRGAEEARARMMRINSPPDEGNK